jgi:adenosine/AMP kinase
MQMEIRSVAITFPDGANIILGQSHFIKTVEDLYELMVAASPSIRFGLAFSEASGPCLVRHDGNDGGLESTAVRIVEDLGAGHSFAIVMTDGFPINVLNAVKSCPEVCGVYCATANPVEVIVAETALGKGVLGVIDGESPKGVEGEEDTEKRKAFLKTIGYKR